MDSAQNSIELQTFEQSMPHNVHTSNTLPVAPTYGIQAASPAINGASQIGRQPRRRAWSSYWRKIRKWWLEFAGAFSSICFLIAIVIFLFKIDGFKLDDWRFPSQIKPPTILSILVTVCRINLAFFVAEGIGQLKWVFFEQREHRISDFDSFDEATRGPWGATCFIWKINRRALVATFGALLAILVLAMDPFSQQVLYYTVRTSNVTTSVATVPSAPLYDSGSLFATLSMDNKTAQFDPYYDDTPPGRPIAAGGPTPFGSIPPAAKDHSLRRREETTRGVPQGASNCSDTLMARAAYAGLFTSMLTPEFTCSTGNCTWPSFTTLGICSSCEDVTQKMTRSCNSGNPRVAGCEECFYKSMEHVLEPGNNHAITNDYEYVPFMRWCAPSPYRYWPLWFTWLTKMSDRYRDLLSFTTFRFPPMDSSTDQACSVPIARIDQCKLFWCAKTFPSAVAVNGNFTQGPSTDMRLVPLNVTNSSCPGVGTLRPPERGSKAPMQAYIREDRACPQSREEIGPYDTFWVNTNDHIMTVNMLAQIIRDREMAIDQNGATYGSKGAEAAVMTALWDNHQGNISLTLADIATAMTNHVRSTAGSIDIIGTTMREDIIVKVTWYWLIYMVAMVGLSLAFFVTAVVFASEKSKVVWKSSSLAVLMHGLTGFDRSELEHETLHDMSTAAKDLWAQLELDDRGGLKLVKH